MDEPLSNLDAKLRVQMRTSVAKLQSDLGTTTVYVTHDQTEAMTLGDRVAVMRSGVLQQVGTPAELYNDAAEHLRRRVHRLAGDELPPGPDRGRPGEAADRRAAAARRRARRRRHQRRDRRHPPGELRGRLAGPRGRPGRRHGRRSAQSRSHLQGQDRPRRVDGLRAVRLLRDRGRDRVRGAGRARPGLGPRRDADRAASTRSSLDSTPRARSAAARRPSSGSTRPSSTSSIPAPACGWAARRRAPRRRLRRPPRKPTRRLRSLRPRTRRLPRPRTSRRAAGGRACRRSRAASRSPRAGGRRPPRPRRGCAGAGSGG